MVCVLGGAIHIYRERREEVEVEASHMVQPLLSNNVNTNLAAEFLQGNLPQNIFVIKIGQIGHINF